MADLHGLLTTCTSRVKFIYLSYTVQSHLPRDDDITHRGLGPHTSITDKKMPYNTILWKYFLKWGFLLSDDFSLYQVDIKLGKSTAHACHPSTVKAEARVQEFKTSPENIAKQQEML